MTDVNPEVSQPSPVATSIPRDEIASKVEGESSISLENEKSLPDTETEHTNCDKAQENGEKLVEHSSRRSDKPKGDNSRGQRHGRGHGRATESKYDPSSMPVDRSPQKIRAQCEFYFGDANLPTDKHMWELTDGPSNKPVSIKKIHEFGRMRNFQPYETIVAALRDSTFFDVVGEEGDEQIKRKRPYDPKVVKDKETRLRHSIYAKGFGEEKPSTQFDIEAFFANYGATNEVRLRRADDTKLFKGSVFVEFTDEKDAEKFLALDPKPLWEGKDHLKIVSKKDYELEKQQAIKDGKIEPHGNRLRHSGNGDSRGRGKGRGGRGNGFKGDRDHKGGRDRGDRDPNDWKKRREHDQASGFKDTRRGGRDNRGRGGRGGDRGPRDRNEERDSRDAGIPKVQTTNEKGEAVSEDSGKKRAREDEGTGETPAKKQDTKEVE